MVAHIPMFSDGLLALLVTLCAGVQFAILRAPDIPEPEAVEAIRRIKIGAMLVLALYGWYMTFFDTGLCMTQPVKISLMLFFGAELYGGLYRLFQIIMDELGYHRCSPKADKQRGHV